MYTREVFEKVQSGLEKYSGYTFQVAFLHRVKMFGFTIAEVPLKFIDRTRGKSKIAPSEYIKNLLLYVVGNSTFIKYLIIGVVGFLVQSLVSKMFIAFGLFPGLAVSVGAFLAIICNFLGNNLWTFSHRRIQGTIELFNKFIHFLITSFGAVVIQGVVVGVGVVLLGQNSWFNLMVFAIVFLVIPYNYFIYDRYIWKSRP